MNDNNKLHKVLCECLDKDVETVSATVQARLTRIRAKALTQHSKTKHYERFGLRYNPMKVSAVFASLLLVVFSSVLILDSNPTGFDESINKNLTIDELIEAGVVNGDVGKEFFLTEEDLDFFENLELYQWLDSEFKMS